MAVDKLYSITMRTLMGVQRIQQPLKGPEALNDTGDATAYGGRQKTLCIFILRPW
jgi:hypothetical protein